MPTHKSTTKGKRPGWPTVFIRSARLALAYQRNRASHPLIALHAFIRDQLGGFLRLLRLGPRRHVQLTRLEIECARAGLGYPHREHAYHPPWRLTTAFATLSASELPPHPLIDAAYLSRCVSTQGMAHPDALSALSQLLSPQSLCSCWTDVPLIGETPVPITDNARVAVCLHLFYPELWPTLRTALENIPEPWDLYVSVPNFACTPSLAQIAKAHPNLRFLPCANRGRDVLPFLLWLEMGVFDRYDEVIKLHTKRSPHVSDGTRWLEQVLQSLLGEPKAVGELLEKMRKTPEIGLIGPRTLLIDSGHRTHKGGNRHVLEALAKRASLPQAALGSPFFAGTMFWFRPAALIGLRAMMLQEEDFPIEMAQTDGTPAHALERLIWPLVEHAGFQLEDTGEHAIMSTAPSFVASRRDACELSK